MVCVKRRLREGNVNDPLPAYRWRITLATGSWKLNLDANVQRWQMNMAAGEAVRLSWSATGTGRLERPGSLRTLRWRYRS